MITIDSSTQRESINSWIVECLASEQHRQNTTNIWLVEVNKLFDWLKIYRLQKKHPEIKIIPLIDSSLGTSVQLVSHLNLPYFLMKPVKKRTFLRTVKQAIESINQDDTTHKDYIRESFLRRLLCGDMISSSELISSETLFPDKVFPNVVYFLQGFIHRLNECEVDRIAMAPMLIQKLLREKLSPILKTVYFIPFHNHLTILSNVPHTYISLRDWTELTDTLLTAMEQLKNDHSIYTYIGVGSVVKEPNSLHTSYLHARKARHTPPSRTMTLRFFEEVSKDVSLQKCFSFIGHHFNEDLSIGVVANHSNLSYNYFSRLFKKETGMSCVDYVTFIRLQRAVWMLRHSDKTIEQIAEETGFNTPNYFSAIFKKHVGLSPSEYRTTREIFFR
ncbi:helix-turn-helix domain-containing protein [Brevibacillus sp. SYSU BS000544]|uniref:helix-turn-helix transcriptional regulator n=1 Tax=Brevibacillus sp. SYSU BS000544 TaxID=3416443 RepID=UPI003CE5236E